VESAVGLWHVVPAQVCGVYPDAHDRARRRVAEPLRCRNPPCAWLRPLCMAAPLPKPAAAGPGRRWFTGSHRAQQREVAHRGGGLVGVDRGKHDADPPAHLFQIQLPPDVVFPQQAQQPLLVGLAD